MEFETLRPYEEKRKLNTLEKVLRRKMELYTDMSLSVKQELEYNSKFINLKAIENSVSDEDLYNYTVEFLKNTPKYNIAEKYISINDETIIIEIGTDVVYYVTLDEEKKIFKLKRRGVPYYHFEMEEANYRKYLVHTLIDYFKSMRFIISIKENETDTPIEENPTDQPSTGEEDKPSQGDNIGTIETPDTDIPTNPDNTGEETETPNTGDNNTGTTEDPDTTN